MINTIKFIIFTILSVCVIKVNAQDKILFKQDDIHMLLPVGNKMAKTSQLIEAPFYEKPNTIIYESDKIGLTIEADKRFIRAVQLPTNENIWYYCETEYFTAKYKIFKYDAVSKKKELVFDNSATPSKHLIFLPFAFGIDENTIYFNTFNIETLEDNLGVWVYDKQHSTFNEIEIGFQYMSEPIISSDRKSLIFTETKTERDLIHGMAELLVSYELSKKTKTTLHQSYGKQINILGFLSTDNNENAKGCEENSFNSGVVYKLPFKPGEEWCITRDGSPRPCPSSITEFCPQAHSGQHGYKALDIAHGDWSTNNTNRDITAAANGTVVMTGLKGSCNGGYGRTVMIEHADGYLTLYAHLSEILVSNGQQVVSGQTIGKEGGSGNTNCQINNNRYARHLHFETRRSINGSTTEYVKFADIGNQTPRQNDVIRSGNTFNSNPTNPPVSTSCTLTVGNPTNCEFYFTVNNILYSLPPNGNYIFTVNDGANYKLQYTNSAVIESRTVNCNNPNYNISTNLCGGVSNSCTSPSNLIASEITASTCSLNWDTGSGATSYVLYYLVNSSWTKLADVNGTGIGIVGMAPGLGYTFAIESICGSTGSGSYTQTTVYTKNFRTSGDFNGHNELYVIEGNPSDFKIVNDFKVYPNPIKNIGNIEYLINTGSKVTVSVTDAIGKEIKTLVNEHKPEGKHLLEFDTGFLPEGIYLCTIRSKNFTKIEKFMVVK